MPDGLVSSRGFQLAVEVLWKWEASSKKNIILPSDWAVAEQGCGFLSKKGYEKRDKLKCVLEFEKKHTLVGILIFENA